MTGNQSRRHRETSEARNERRPTAVSSTLALALVAIPQLALAATTYLDTVVDREFFAMSTVGGFVLR
jgi:hypothetical protein